MFNPFADDEPEYDEEGRIKSIPAGWTVEYLISAEGYSGDEWITYSEMVYGPPQASTGQILSAAGLSDKPDLWFGRDREVEWSIAESALRKADIPQKGRTFTPD